MNDISIFAGMARSYDTIVGAGHAREYLNGTVGTDENDKNVGRISVAKSEKNLQMLGYATLTRVNYRVRRKQNGNC